MHSSRMRIARCSNPHGRVYIPRPHISPSTPFVHTLPACPHTPCPGACWDTHTLPRCMLGYISPCEQTNTCENITFPQHRLRVVKSFTWWFWRGAPDFVDDLVKSVEWSEVIRTRIHWIELFIQSSTLQTRLFTISTSTLQHDWDLDINVELNTLSIKAYFHFWVMANLHCRIRTRTRIPVQ